jgi:hypothetical protein
MNRHRLKRQATAALGLCIIGIFSAGAAHSAAASGRVASSPRWLTFDAGKQLAMLTLIPNYNDVDSGYNFDGYSRGKMVVSVPLGWQVRVLCRVSAEAFVTHSCGISTSIGSDKLAFLHAKIPNAMNGLPPGDSATFTFTASKLGTYAIECLVPGHDDATMWDVFKVTTDVRPSLVLK